MNGHIVVTSNLGKGSIFTCEVKFPLQPVAILPSLWDDYKNRVRVLIVDDTARGDVLRKHLGSNLVSLTQGKYAVNTVITANKTNEPFDVLIVDQQLSSGDP